MSAGEAAGSWRVALRIARRSALRHRGRSLLVLLMLAVPVFGGTVLAAAWSNLGLQTERQGEWQVGRADLRVNGIDDATVIASLPPGSRTSPFAWGNTIVAAPAGYTAVEYESADVDNPLLDGKYVRRAGRAPRAAGEVAVTAALAASLGVNPGDRVSAGLPVRPLTVTGVFDAGRSLRLRALIAPAGTALSPAPYRGLLVDVPDGVTWRPPSDGDGTGVLEPIPPSVAERALLAAAVTLVTGFAGAQVALLAGAAFSIGARRQRRELGLIGAVGATGRQVGRVVLAGGGLVGAVAGLVGIAAGLLAFRAAASTVERVADHPLAGTTPPWLHLAAILALAVTVGLVAALVPARSAARQPVRATLTARSTRPHRTGWLLAAGLLLITSGVAGAVWSAHPSGRPEAIAAAAVAVLLGAAACAPALVGGLGLTAPALPLSLRLAMRQAARHRMRTGVAVAVVSSAIAGSVALALVDAAETKATTEAVGATADGSVDVVTLRRAVARSGQVVLPPSAAGLLSPPDLARIAGLLRAGSTVPLRRAVRADDTPVEPAYDGRQELSAPVDQRWVAVGGPEEVRVTAGREASAAERDVLARGGAVVFHPQYASGGRTALTGGDGPPVALDAVVVPVDRDYEALPGMLISPETARRLGLDTRPAGVVFDRAGRAGDAGRAGHAGRAPTAAQVAAADSIVLTAQAHAPAGAIDAPAPVRLGGEPPDRSLAPRTGTMFYVLIVLSALVTLLASGMAVGLAAAEGRDDMSTMAAVGAGPRVRRSMAAAQAGVIVGLGALCGLAVGIVPAAGLVGYSSTLQWRLPWGPLSGVLAVPVVAVALAWLLTRPRLVLTRRIN